VTVDSQDNIIVVGSQSNPAKAAGDTDAVIRKYDSGGNLLWHFDYDGGENKNEALWGVCVDQNDNIIAVGEQYVTGNSDDFLLMKLDPDGNAEE
jgi:hypothetical protein